jgi:hypothetical protein
VGTVIPVIGLRGFGYNINLTDVTITNGPTAAGGALLRVDHGISGSGTDVVLEGTVFAQHANQSTLFTLNGVAGGV